MRQRGGNIYTAAYIHEGVVGGKCLFPKVEVEVEEVGRTRFVGSEVGLASGSIVEQIFYSEVGSK